jgi:hypothetical protein
LLCEVIYTAYIYNRSDYTFCSLAAAQYTSSTIKHLFEVMIIYFLLLSVRRFTSFGWLLGQSSNPIPARNHKITIKIDLFQNLIQ